MQSGGITFLSIGSIIVHYDENHVNFGPAPDLILVHFRAVSARATGPYLSTAVLMDGYEDVEFRADGIVTYHGNYLLTVDGCAPLLLTYSGMSDVGEQAYEYMLDDLLPDTIGLDASARFLTSVIKYRWLNRLQYNAFGKRNFRGGSGSCELFAHIEGAQES